MIKNFEQFKKNLNKDLIELDKIKVKVANKEAEIDKKYQEELTESISIILDALRDKYDFECLFEFLKQETIDNASDFRYDLSDVEVKRYGNYYMVSDICDIVGNWAVKVNLTSFDREEVYLEEIHSQALYQIFNILLKYTSGILNAELYKNINK